MPKRKSIDPRVPGLSEVAVSKQPKTAKAKVSQARLFRSHSMNLLKTSEIAESADPMLQDLRSFCLKTDDSDEADSQLHNQLRILAARHHYVALRRSARAIAGRFNIDATTVHEWVETWGWQEMREARTIRRGSRFQNIREANYHVVERRSDNLFAKVQTVAGQLLDDHINGEVAITASELKAIADTLKTAFEIRGALACSEKVGTKLKIEMSVDVQRQLGEVIKHVQSAPSFDRLVAPSDQNSITIEDAEFDTVTR